MSPVRTRRWDGTVLVGSGGGTVEEPDDLFISGLNEEGVISTTQPTIPTWDNTGHTGTLTAYTGPNAGGLLNVNVAGTIFENVDFGNTRVKVNVPNVSFINCRWDVTNCPSDGYAATQVDFRPSGNTGGGYMYKCTLENVAQNIRGRNGVMGWNVTIKRCRVRGFVDNFGFYVPGTPGVNSLPSGIDIIDTYIGEVAWCQHNVGGVVHISDTKTHSDCIQFQGGSGARIINTAIIGQFSTTVGTGTPGSGSDTGWPDMPYTQAEGEAMRYATVQGGGTYATPGTRGYNMGGSISGIMVNTSTSKGQVLGYELHWVYGSGGAYWLNSAGTTIGNWGTINHLRIVDDQRVTSSGLGVAVAITPGTSLTMTDAYYAADSTSWASTGTVITRRNT